MGSIFGELLSNPVASSVIIIICICLLLGYYIVVMPMYKENALLKERNENLENRLLDALERIEDDYKDISSSMSVFHKLALDLKDREIKVLSDIESYNSELKDLMTRLMKNITKELKNDSSIDTIITRIKAILDKHSNDAHTNMIIIQSDINDIKNKCESIKDKLSTLNGIVVASSTINGSHNVGVK